MSKLVTLLSSDIAHCTTETNQWRQSIVLPSNLVFRPQNLNTSFWLNHALKFDPEN